MRKLFRIARLAAIVCVCVPAGFMAGTSLSMAFGPSPGQRNVGHIGVTSVLPGKPKDGPWKSPQEGILSIQARASIENKRVPENLVWFFEIYDDQKELIGRDVYKHTSFHAPKGWFARPSFRESFPIPPGLYYVVVGLESDDGSGVVAASAGFEEVVR